MHCFLKSFVHMLNIFVTAIVYIMLAETAFNAVFTVEMVLRMISLGGVWAYLKHPWNMFDFFMVVAGYTAFIPTGSSNTGGIRALRAMRALRPLRSITRFEALRSIVVCFLEVSPVIPPYCSKTPRRNCITYHQHNESLLPVEDSGYWYTSATNDSPCQIFISAYFDSCTQHGCACRLCRCWLQWRLSSCF